MVNEMRRNSPGGEQVQGIDKIAARTGRPATETSAQIAPASNDACILSLPDLKARRGMSQLLERCQQYAELEVAFDETDGVLWCYMNSGDCVSGTVNLARESRDLQIAIGQMSEDLASIGDLPIRYMVWCSNAPGVFSLGGDLSLLATLVRNKDREALADYAINCIDVVHANATSMDLPIITVSLVEGDARGGGFEVALSSNLVFADHNARFALPELQFNLFPGMGMYSFIARRLSVAQAERMILSGRVYTGHELQEMGLVDELAEPGLARAAASDYIAKYSQRHGTQCAVYKAGRRVNPIEYDELHDLAIMWVDAAMALGEADAAMLQRLIENQDSERMNRNMEI